MKNLTLTQRCIIIDLVHTAQASLEWDEELGEYADGGRMMLSLTEEEYQELMSINTSNL